MLAPTEPVVVDGWIEAQPTEPQTEIWLSAQLGDAASCAFNEGISLRLDGALDDAALTDALNRSDRPPRRVARRVQSRPARRWRALPRTDARHSGCRSCSRGANAGLAGIIDE